MVPSTGGTASSAAPHRRVALWLGVAAVVVAGVSFLRYIDSSGQPISSTGALDSGSRPPQSPWSWDAVWYEDLGDGSTLEFGSYEFHAGSDVIISPSYYEAGWLLRRVAPGRRDGWYLVWFGREYAQICGLQLRGERKDGSLQRVWVVRQPDIVTAALDLGSESFVSSYWPRQPDTDWPVAATTPPRSRVGFFSSRGGVDFAHGAAAVALARLPKWAGSGAGGLLFATRDPYAEADPATVAEPWR